MGNRPPYQPGQPPEDQPDQAPGNGSRQEYAHQNERPHDVRLDRPAFYQPGQLHRPQGGSPQDHLRDQPTLYRQASNQTDAWTAEQQQAPRLRIRRRPCGVMLMSAFLLAQGVFLMIAGVFGVLGIVALIFDISRGSTLLLHGMLSFALGILSIIFAFGMFMLTRWAFWAAVVIAFLNLMTSLTVLLQTGFASFGHIISGVFSLVVLFYFLFDPDARAAFTKEAPSLFEF